jgi:hypothetical protein
MMSEQMARVYAHPRWGLPSASDTVVVELNENPQCPGILVVNLRAPPGECARVDKAEEGGDDKLASPRPLLRCVTVGLDLGFGSWSDRLIHF